MDDLRGLSRIGQVTRGARYALAGMRLVLTHAALWPYLIAPALITISAFVGVVLFAWPVVGWLIGLLWSPGAETSLWISAAWYGFWFVVRLSIVVGSLLVLYFASSIIATPFNDRLSEHVETMVLGPYQEESDWRTMLGDLVSSVVHSCLSLSVWLLVLAVSFLLNLIPFVGTVASFVIGTVATALFVARESMDGSLSRRRMTFRHKIVVLKAQFPMMMGFGMVMSALLWIPLLNFVVIPMAVAGGTLMLCQLEKAGLVPDPTGKLGFLSDRLRVASLADHELTDELDHLGEARAHAPAHAPTRVGEPG